MGPSASRALAATTSFCVDAAVTARSARSSNTVLPSAPTTARLQAVAPATAGANAACKFPHNFLRSPALHAIGSTGAVAHARSAARLLDFSATQDVFFNACSPKNRDERADDTMSVASGLAAECACATNQAVPMLISSSGRAIANVRLRLRTRERRDLLLKPTVLLT